MLKFLTRDKKRFLMIILAAIAIVGLFSLFSWKLSCKSLESFDEAWYAAIANNTYSGKVLGMEFNGVRFTDHPPLGIYLIALSGLVFNGVNEFSARIPSVFAGVGCILVVYFLSAQLLKSKTTGVISSLMLISSLWFILRVRSGNLDILWMFFYLLSILMSTIVIKKPKLF